MPMIEVSRVGEDGVIIDIPGHESRPESWTRVENVRFVDGYATRSLGEEEETEGAPPIIPNFIFPGPTVSTLFWVYTDLDKVRAVTAETHTDITRVSGDYGGTLDNKWSDAWLNGLLILNNGGVDLPQVWNPMSSSQPLIDLPNWVEGGVTTLRAKVIRPFGNFLVALHITKDTAVFPTMVKWSNRADPGTVPDSWDITDASKAAGEVSRSNTPGFLVDCLPLGNANIVYKEQSMTRMIEIPGNDIFDFKDFSNTVGAMALNCAKEFIPGQHIVLTLDRDVVVHNGNGPSVTSIVEDKLRQYLIDNIDQDNFRRSFIVVNYNARECWVCYPLSGSTYCNQAAVWNWKDNTWSFRKISDTLDIKTGLFSPTQISDAWSDQTLNWDQMARTWGQALFTQGASAMLGAFVTDNELRRVDITQKRGATAYSSVLEHIGMAIIGRHRDGSPRVDQTRSKLVTEIWPVIEAIQATTFQISVGSQQIRDGAVEWQGPKDFDPATDKVLDFEVDGPYISTRFECADETAWKFYGYTMNLKDNGRYF